MFPPDDTASNLNPGDDDSFIQDPAGHGNINLGALFQIEDLSTLPPAVEMIPEGDDHCRIRWFGAGGCQYDLQMSHDMLTWHTMETTNLVNGAMIEFDMPTNVDRCFFRIRQH